jgi:hypothetical protein
MLKDVESHRIIQGYETYSQANQDLLVWLMLDFKRDGTYVDIGESEPKQSNNSYILEKAFNWNRFTLEIDPKLTYKSNEVRRNRCIYADPSNFKFKKEFLKSKFPLIMD